MEHYLLIKQGTIHDAVEKEPYIADILIENGKIKKIAPILEGAMINDAKIIDATIKYCFVVSFFSCASFNYIPPKNQLFLVF